MHNIDNEHSSSMYYYTNQEFNSLTLIPLGYFDHLSPLGGGGLIWPPPPSDLGN